MAHNSDKGKEKTEVEKLIPDFFSTLIKWRDMEDEAGEGIERIQNKKKVEGSSLRWAL